MLLKCDSLITVEGGGKTHTHKHKNLSRRISRNHNVSKCEWQIAQVNMFRVCVCIFAPPPLPNPLPKRIHTASRGIYLTPYCQRWACGGDESMPSQCGPSFYSYGHRLTLVRDNRGALPLAPCQSPLLSPPHPSPQSYFQNNNTAGVGVGRKHDWSVCMFDLLVCECVCLLCVYTCVLLFLGTRSVSGRVRTCSFDLCLWLRACSLKATACRHAFVCVCVQMQARWWVCVCELGLWWHGRSVPNVTACWGGVESEGWQRWASCPHTVYPAAAQGSPANLKGPKESPP